MQSTQGQNTNSQGYMTKNWTSQNH